MIGRSYKIFTSSSYLEKNFRSCSAKFWSPLDANKIFLMLPPRHKLLTPALIYGVNEHFYIVFSIANKCTRYFFFCFWKNSGFLYDFWYENYFVYTFWIWIAFSEFWYICKHTEKPKSILGNTKRYFICRIIILFNGWWHMRIE